MGEKRKSSTTMLLRKQGMKTHKIELFDAEDFKLPRWMLCKAKRYRIRIDGKWYKRSGEKISVFTKWEFRDLLFRAFKP